MQSLSPTDFLLITGYLLLIFVYAQHFHTRQSIAAIVGYTALLVGKRLEYSGKDSSLVKNVKKVGYAALLMTPSFEHWHDVFAIIGYVYCVLGMTDQSPPPLAAYYLLGAERSLSDVSRLGRSLVAMALIFGYKSPFW